MAGIPSLRIDITPQPPAPPECEAMGVPRVARLAFRGPIDPSTVTTRLLPNMQEVVVGRLGASMTGPHGEPPGSSRNTASHVRNPSYSSELFVSPGDDSRTISTVGPGVTTTP